MAPLRFLRALYCVDAALPAAARARRRSCAAVRPRRPASARFAADTSRACSSASGFADHPYPQGAAAQCAHAQRARLSPSSPSSRKLERVAGHAAARLRLSHASSPSGRPSSATRPSPPIPRRAPSRLTMAAYYLNWSEYLSWLDPRMQVVRPVPAGPIRQAPLLRHRPDVYVDGSAQAELTTPTACRCISRCQRTTSGHAAARVGRRAARAGRRRGPRIKPQRGPDPVPRRRPAAPSRSSRRVPITDRHGYFEAR